ncbi:MAG: hypothetical protein Q9221_006866 [Calogaya cf. arnoldii]
MSSLKRNAKTRKPQSYRTTPTPTDLIFFEEHPDACNESAKQEPAEHESPLDLLHQQIGALYDEGPGKASAKFAALQEAVMSGETTVPLQSSCLQSKPLLADQLAWNSCKLAANLILTLAGPDDTTAIFEAMNFQSETLGGLPTIAIIGSTPSASLSTAFAKAKKAAIDGKVGKVTVIGISLMDVEMVEREEQRSMDMKYTSFAHTFVLGVSRVGWRIYQAWGKHGYGLDEWLWTGGAEVRDWDAARKFLKAFTRLEKAKGSWFKQINDDYNECFHVDIMGMCETRGLRDPIVPVYRPWVRLFTIEDVKTSNLEKFTWE